MEIIIVALISALAPTLAVIVGYVLSSRQRERIGNRAESQAKQIHVLVNSRLSKALSEIKVLKDKLGIPTTLEEDEAHESTPL